MLVPTLMLNLLVAMTRLVVVMMLVDAEGDDAGGDDGE